MMKTAYCDGVATIRDHHHLMANKSRMCRELYT